MVKKRILVVDDEPAMTTLISLNLERAGCYEVRTENLALKALDAAREFHPDLIMLDVIMPGMFGSEVAVRLAADPELCAIKYVFLTSMLTREEALRSHGRIGGHTFIAKPFNGVELCQVIEEQFRQ